VTSYTYTYRCAEYSIRRCVDVTIWPSIVLGDHVRVLKLHPNILRVNKSVSVTSVIIKKISEIVSIGKLNVSI